MEHSSKGERKIDVTSLFKEADILTDHVDVVETKGMYPYKANIEENWVYYTAVAMKRLMVLLNRERRITKTIGIIGIGNGIEAIAMAKIFQGELKHIIMTDIDKDVLCGAVRNVSNSISDCTLKLTPLIGSLCKPIERTGCKVDFVYGNIPNLPTTGYDDISKGAERGTFISPSAYEASMPPEIFSRWALAAQFAYLQGAKRILALGGSVITELGGRLPISVIQELFKELGLGFQEIIVGFKVQTEAFIDFQGYQRFEKEYGTSFEFYLYKESKALLESKGISNPSSDVSGEEVKEWLKPFKVSAGEALNLYQKNIHVGHTVHVLRGNLK